MSLPVVILVGGLATRLRSMTEKIPKSLLIVAGKPFVFHQIELLKANGLNKIIMCVGHLGEAIRDEVGDGSRWGIHVSYSFDGPTLLGTGGSIRKALHLLNDSFFVLYGDSYLECDYSAVERSYRDSKKLGLMTVYRNEDKWDKSNVLFRDGKIVSHNKTEPTTDMRHIDYGLGVLAREALEPYETDKHLDLSEVYQDLLQRDQLAAYESRSRFYEIGSPEGIAETRKYLEGREL